MTLGPLTHQPKHEPVVTNEAESPAHTLITETQKVLILLYMKYDLLDLSIPKVFNSEPIRAGSHPLPKTLNSESRVQ